MTIEETGHEVDDSAIDRKELLAQQFDEMSEQKEDPIEIEVSESEEIEEEIEEEVEEPIWKRPPSSWKKEFHETWQGADPKLQEYAWQREEEMRKGVEPLITKAQYADQMQKAFEPYMDTIRGNNSNPVDAIKGLMEADRVLRFGSPEEKRSYMAMLATNYGVDLNGSAQFQTGPIDPKVIALQNELNNIRGEVSGWKQQREEAENQSLLGQIDQFAQKAEYFEEVRPTMIQLLQNGIVNTLEEAYEKAIRLDDNLFSEIQQSQQAKLETERRDSANRAAKAAKAAAVSVRSSTPGVPTATKAQDRRSMLLEQFDGMNDRL
jgi:hypothetical protein